MNKKLQWVITGSLVLVGIFLVIMGLSVPIRAVVTAEVPSASVAVCAAILGIVGISFCVVGIFGIPEDK